MNILLYANTFLPKVGGRELVVYYLARSLHELGHRVRVVGPAHWLSDRSLKLPFPVHRYPSFIRKQFRQTSGAMRTLKEAEKLSHFMLDRAIWGCDIVHAHTTYPTGFLAARANRIMGSKPLVITPHGADINTIPELDFGMRMDPEIAPRIDKALSAADAVTAISDGIRGTLHSIGVSEEKLVSIPNGVDLERFSAREPWDFRAESGIGADERVIVTVGNYHPRKGHEGLVRSFSRVLETVPRSRLVIVGRGTDVLRPLIRELGLDERVILGSVALPASLFGGDADTIDAEPDKLRGIYQASDLYVSAGVGESAEGLSLAVLEAMASGLPIIGTRIKGNSDVIEDGVNGFLVDPSDEAAMASRIQAFFNPESDMRNLREGALSRIQSFGWLNIAKQYAALYDRVVAG